MKYKFYPNESRIYDFLQFPRLLYLKEEDIEKDLDLESEKFFDRIKKIQTILKPFEKEINHFYINEFSNQYDFFFILTSVYPIRGHQSVESYLEMLKTLDKDTFRKDIIHGILTIEEEERDQFQVLKEKAHKIAKSKEEMLGFIKDLPIDPSYKWNYFLMVEEPNNYISMFIELMLKLLPIFESESAPYVKEITEVGEYLVGELNSKGKKAISDLSFNMIKPELIDDQIESIYVSLCNPYSFMLREDLHGSFIVWGFKMEEGFRNLNAKNEDKINNRIQIFKSLSDKTRYEVLKLIANQVTSTKEIAERLGVSSATISYHINTFLTIQLIKLDKGQKKVSYVVNNELLESFWHDFKQDIGF